MPVQKGQVLNPIGSRAHHKAGQRALNKIRNSLNKAIDGLGDVVEGQTASELSVLIAEALRKDVVGTLKGLSFCLPKEIQVEHKSTKDLDTWSDEDLAELISKRAQANYAMERTIQGEVVQDDEDHEDAVTVDSCQDGVSD